MGASVAEILLAQGQRAAEARRRMGEIQAGMWRDVGQIAGNTIQTIGQHYADEPARADAAKLRGLQVEGAEQQVDAGRREVEAVEQGKRRDAAFQGLFEMYPDGNIPEREVLSIYGPQAGEKVFGALGAFADLRANRVKDAQQTAARLAMGLSELAPDTQAQFWGPVREAAIQGGLGKHDDIPEQFSPEYLNQVLAWSTGQDPTPAPPKVTFGQEVKRYTVGGKTVLGRVGSDGQVYDVRTREPFQPEDLAADPARAGGGSDYSEYLERAARSLGRASRAELTTAEEDGLRQKFYAAARAPQRQPSARPAANPRGASAIPQGVETYILDMRGRGYTQSEALTEVLRPDVWRGLLQAHPKLTAERMREAITRLVPEEGAPPVAPPSAPGAANATQPAGDRVLSLAELRAAAQRLGIDETKARQEYEKRGFTIR